MQESKASSQPVKPSHSTSHGSAQHTYSQPSVGLAIAGHGCKSWTHRHSSNTAAAIRQQDTYETESGSPIWPLLGRSNPQGRAYGPGFHRPALDQAVWTYSSVSTIFCCMAGHAVARVCWHLQARQPGKGQQLSEHTRCVCSALLRIVLCYLAAHNSATTTSLVPHSRHVSTSGTKQSEPDAGRAFLPSAERNISILDKLLVSSHAAAAPAQSRQKPPVSPQLPKCSVECTSLLLHTVDRA